jgi:integrase
LSPRRGVDQAANAPAWGINELPSGALRVRVYSGMDPISKRRMYLTEVVPPGPKAGDEAEKIRTRLLHQVDQKRNPRTRATVGQLLDKWLQVLDVDPSTRRPVEAMRATSASTFGPVLGSLPLTRLDVETLDSFALQVATSKKQVEQ